MRTGSTELMISTRGGISFSATAVITLVIGGTSFVSIGPIFATVFLISGVRVLVRSWMTGIRLSISSPTIGMSSFRELNMVAASGSSAT